MKGDWLFEHVIDNYEQYKDGFPQATRRGSSLFVVVR